jgi:hypothetical protein
LRADIVTSEEKSTLYPLNEVGTHIFADSLRRTKGEFIPIGYDHLLFHFVSSPILTSQQIGL